ncbi:MAG: PrsW family intramembrane metalloprotease [Mojavia pulchra JT2-VF2]|uniref:PrsW family intramembrane metalloprotease n=1 Tax=Mojavia pulchra JT2-VF2 TaxID=287848 RepID=A0A951Q1S8_9NOST|nr:PrsW family intramembrane metalloprotease [Mojavia pulchra JT2-VF2]
MAEFSVLLWAVIPPLLLLFYYYYRIFPPPSLLHLLLLFILGAVSGFVALSLETAFETVAKSIINWQQLGRSLPGSALRQLVEVGPIEEGCKLVAVIAPTYYLKRKYRLRSSTVFLFTIAVALGFTAQENWIYFFYNTASILERSIGTPVHAMFSAPWGYALGITIASNLRLHRDRKLVTRAWLNSVFCHALVNVLSIAWRYSFPVAFLSYGLFPLLLWMFWRLEQLLRRTQGKPAITLISSHIPKHRYWQRGLVLFALMLGGNAIFGLFLLARNVSLLNWAQIFYPNALWYILSRFLINLIFAIVAWLIYRYLRYLARQCFKY